MLSDSLHFRKWKPIRGMQIGELPFDFSRQSAWDSCGFHHQTGAQTSVPQRDVLRLNLLCRFVEGRLGIPPANPDFCVVLPASPFGLCRKSRLRMFPLLRPKTHISSFQECPSWRSRSMPDSRSGRSNSWTSTPLPRSLRSRTVSSPPRCSRNSSSPARTRRLPAESVQSRAG